MAILTARVATEVGNLLLLLKNVGWCTPGYYLSVLFV
jgi:hypothetical protein